MSFDCLARHYRWMETLLAGEKLQQCRLAFIDEVAEARNVLICGEGRGRFLQAYIARNPSAKVVSLDASARMLELSATTLTPDQCSRVEFIHQDLLQWNPPEQRFDLIVTHFFLDCFPSNQLEVVIKKLSSCSTPNALWAFSDFHIPSTRLAGARARAIQWAMYRFFRLITKIPAKSLVSPEPFLRAHGFRPLKQRVGEWGLLRTDLWQRKS